jgi:transcriptional regulator with XRE-family HTH domain/tetratricopeptide (TPR) repeat protein
MASHLGLWLREQRHAHGWSADEMARRLHRAAKANDDTALPPSSTLAAYIRRWERGTTAPTERYRLHYCTALGIPPAQFGPGQDQNEPEEPADNRSGFLPGIPDALRPRPGADLLGRLSGPGGYRETEEHATAADHREWPAGAITTPDQVISAIAEESQDFGEWADTSNVGDATLEHYTTQVRQLARDYVHAPPYPLLLDAKRLRDRVFAKLQGHQRPDQTRDLYLIAVQVCGMLAWMSGDFGYQRAAQTHAWTAWVCAEQAVHDGARAWVRAAQSKLAYWDARYIESAQLAGDGLRYAASGSVPALLASQMARALARAGRPDDAGQALARARDEQDRARGEDEIGGAFGLTSAQYHYLAGTTQLWRHDPAQAIAESAQAIELFQARRPGQPHYGPEALTRIDQARAYLQLGDLEGAHTALRPVLSLSPDLRMEMLTQNLGLARQQLAEPVFRDAAVARELQEEIETYCRESIVNDIGG